MKLYVVLTAISGLGFVFAFPSAVALAGPDTHSINIVLLQDKITSQVSLTALTGDSSGILGRSCSKSLDSGLFSNLPIAFDVDENGAGNITIGSDTFPVRGAVDESGQISCSRIDSEVDSLASCVFGIPSSSSISLGSVVVPVYHEDLAECFSGHGVRVSSFLRLPSRAQTTGLMGRENLNVTALETIDKRQEDCGVSYDYTTRVGDGDPWQAPLHTQLSLNLDCGDGDCAVGRFQSQSITIGFSASGSLYGWIDAGFEVSFSVETGDSYECNAGPRERVCIWKEVGRTAYKVINMQVTPCLDPYPTSGIIEVVSPNKNDVGSRMYCVRGEGNCRGRGQRYESPRFRGGPGTPCC